MKINNYDRLALHAYETQDTFLRQMLTAQERHPQDWEGFLVDVILTLSTVNKDLTARLVEEISRRPPQPVVINGTTYTYAPDGSWAGDYVEFTPDGGWPKGS
jgi:hypothetical protein